MAINKIMAANSFNSKYCLNTCYVQVFDMMLGMHQRTKQRFLCPWSLLSDEMQVKNIRQHRVQFYSMLEGDKCYNIRKL